VVAAASVLLAWWGFGLPGQFAAAVLGTALFFALTAGFALPRLRGWNSAPRAPIDSSALWRLRWPMTITGVGGQVNLLTDYIVVGYMIDPVSVTVFSITQRLVTVLGGFITSLTNVSWAGLAEVLTTEGSAMLEARMLELVRLLVGVGLAVVGTLAAFNGHFVTLWVGRQYYAGDALTLLTAMQTILFGFTVLFANTVDMQGDTRHRVGVTSAGAALNLTLSLMLVRPFGMSGVTLGTVLGYLAADAWYSPFLVCRRYGVRGRAIVFETLRSVALCIPWVVAVWFWVHTRTEIGTWREFALDFFAANAIAAVYCWFIILTRADRNLWRVRLSAMSPMLGFLRK
jgi:O-antigen/teichoic acid export membrane protein